MMDVGTVRQLCNLTADDLLEQRNFGVMSLEELRKKLANHGLKLRYDG